MNNILAIAHKEVKAYFASPIAYIVIGFSAVLFGFFFYSLLDYFMRISLQAGGGFGAPESVNVNEMMISPLLARVMPAMTCKSVVLPLPLLPTSAICSPESTRKSGMSRIGNGLPSGSTYDFLMSRS